MNFLSTVLVFGLAFVVLPFGTSWHEIPKVLVALLGIAGLSVVFFWQGFAWRRYHLVHIGLFLLSLWGLATQWTPTSFFGNPFRLQGILTLWALLLWSIVSSQTKLDRNQPKFATLALAVALFIAVIGRTDPSGRAVGSVGEANSLGAFFVFLTPLTQSIFAIIPAIIGLVLSGSRSAVIGLVASLSIWFGSKKVKLTIVVLTTGCILLTTLFLPFLEPKQDFDYRVDIWRTAIRAGSEKPILGWGVGNVEVALKSAAEHEQTFIRYQYVDSSHNVFLDWWVQGGIVGLALFTGLLILAIRGLIKAREVSLLAGLFGILAVMLFNPVSISILVPFWWLIGKGLRRYTTITYGPHQI